MTTGHNYDFYDPLGFQFPPPPMAPTTFSLSEWDTMNSFDSDDEEEDDEGEGDLSGADRDMFGWHNTADAKRSRVEKLNGSTAAPEVSASCCLVTGLSIDSNNTARSSNTRVRFSEEPEIRCYEQVDREYFSILFYSVHELQKMCDEARKEKEDTKV